MADAADADAEVSLAEVDEVSAQARYHEATARAGERPRGE
jgi:hypothetical protein